MINTEKSLKRREIIQAFDTLSFGVQVAVYIYSMSRYFSV